MHEEGISRRSVLSWAAAIGIAVPAGSLLLSGCGSDSDADAGSGSGTKKTSRLYQTAFGYNVGNAPEMVAREAGFFADLGIDGKVISSTGTPQAMSGLLAKTTDYSRFMSISAMVTIANEDAPFVAFGTPVQRSSFEMQSMGEKPIKDIRELEGKSVGIVSAGGTTDQLIDLMAVQAGINPKSIKRKVTGLGTAAYQFAVKGDVVAWTGSAAEREALEQAGSSVHAWNFDDVAPIPGDSLHHDPHRDREEPRHRRQDARGLLPGPASSSATSPTTSRPSRGSASTTARSPPRSPSSSSTWCVRSTSPRARSS